MIHSRLIHSFFLRRLDDGQLDAWIRAQAGNSTEQQRGLREFRRRQEACHREHDLLTIRVGMAVSLILASAAFGAVFAAGGLAR